MQTRQRNPKKRESRLLQTWYRWMAPPDPGADAELKLREEARRGRLLSIIVPIEFLVVLPAMPLGIVTHAYFLTVLDILGEIAFICAILLSRRGYVNIAALLAVMASEAGIMGVVAGQAFIPGTGGITPTSFQLSNLLVQPQIIAVALLPEAAVIFGLVVIDTIYIISILYSLPHTVDVSHLLATGAPGFISLTLMPLTLYIIVAFFGFLLVSSTKQALIRADRAETVTRLQRDITEHIRQAAQEKEALERDIQHIIHVHTAIAGGDFSARANLPPSTVLWPIVGSLNNLLNRTQRWRNEAQELYKIRNTVVSLIQQLSIARRQGQGFVPPRTHTFLDPLLLELPLKHENELMSPLHSRQTANQLRPPSSLRKGPSQ